MPAPAAMAKYHCADPLGSLNVQLIHQVAADKSGNAHPQVLVGGVSSCRVCQICIRAVQHNKVVGGKGGNLQDGKDHNHRQCPEVEHTASYRLLCRLPGLRCCHLQEQAEHTGQNRQRGTGISNILDAGGSGDPQGNLGGDGAEDLGDQGQQAMAVPKAFLSTPLASTTDMAMLRIPKVKP